MFNIGDLAVYPAQGVGVIKAIESREFGGNSQEFYILSIFENEMTVMVPVNNASTLGLRALMPEKTIKNVFTTLCADQVVDKIASWSQRQREYTDKIKTGDPIEVAEVVRELSLIKVKKELSYGEKKVFDTAKRLLIKEISLAEGIEETSVEERLNQTLN